MTSIPITDNLTIIFVDQSQSNRLDRGLRLLVEQFRR
jgi:hypothetical protein